MSDHVECASRDPCVHRTMNERVNIWLDAITPAKTFANFLMCLPMLLLAVNRAIKHIQATQTAACTSSSVAGPTWLQAGILVHFTQLCVSRTRTSERRINGVIVPMKEAPPSRPGTSFSLRCSSRSSIASDKRPCFALTMPRKKSNADRRPGSFCPDSISASKASYISSRAASYLIDFTRRCIY